MAQQSQDFGQYSTLEPALGPLEATEEPTKEEIDALDDINAEVLNFIHGDNQSSVLASISNGQELYQGIGSAAFQIMLATKSKFEQGGEPIPPASLFGEGGAIHTTVDELFQLAQAAGVPGADDQDQYSAAMMETMRQVGEYIEQTGDDASVAETQELLIDIEQTGGQGVGEPELGEEDALRGTIQRSLDAQNQALSPEQTPVQDAAQAAPQQQSAVPETAGGPVQPQGGILNG